MKHESTVTLVLILIFAISQFVGLSLVGKSLDYTCQQEGDVELCGVTSHDTVIGERPQTEGVGSVLYIVIGVAIGTGLLLLIIKYGQRRLWRVWFFLAVWITTAIALGVIVPVEYQTYAWIAALGLALWKVLKPNMIIYNVAEVLMYSGMAVLLVPILYVSGQSSEWLSVWPALALLGIISIYDMIAVWKSGHMVTMAKFITSSNAFAGLVVPYKTKEKKMTMDLQAASPDSLQSTSPVKNAILGGGDITFPLLFAGAIMHSRTISLVKEGVVFSDALTTSFFSALLIGLGATLAIAGLFFFAKKDRFYPAMPFVTAGCMAGWALSLLV